MLGKMRVFTFEKKNDTDTPKKTVKGYLVNPSTRQKSWYQIQTNSRLVGNIEFAGDVDNFIKYDAVTISKDNKKYKVVNMSQKTFGKVTGEVII